jgi:transposase
VIPSEYSSGGRKQRLGHISKQGNPFLRGLLVEAAQSAVRPIPNRRGQTMPNRENQLSRLEPKFSRG